MYVPLSNRGEYDYIFGKPASSLTMGSLVEYITRGGTMMTHYGDAFNEYVALQLKTKTSFHVAKLEAVFWKDGKKWSGGQKKRGDEIKVDMYKSMYDAFAPWRDGVFMYLCMEKLSIWERAFGYAYDSNADFEIDFGRRTLPPRS